jgi:pyruvate dehydrogenase E2 component (dihydrolipoamide acetyltransferase)
MRRAIATRLTESKQTVPHFYLRAALRVDRLLALRTEINEAGQGRVSVNDLLLRAVALTQRRVPDMNVTWTEDVVRHHHDVDIAVAVATDAGLLTPVLRSGDRMSVRAISAAVTDLATRARDGKIRPDELEGGSISVTNLGMFGTDDFAAIIKPPHAAILAIGAARDEAVVTDGQLAVGTVLHVTLAVDHRPVDGVVAARWLAAFRDYVESPVRILA